MNVAVLGTGIVGATLGSKLVEVGHSVMMGSRSEGNPKAGQWVESSGGKTLIDVANPLDFSKGMPPTLTVCNTDSLGEQIQRAFPKLKVVKALNTLNCSVMVDPRAGSRRASDLRKR